VVIIQIILNKMVKKGAFKRKREQCVTYAQVEVSILIRIVMVKKFMFNFQYKSC
jgi:hypothetical protein